MHNFDFFKKTPVKVIAVCVLFLIFTGVISWAIYYPCGKIFSNSNNYETAFIGASEISCGVIPEIVDQNANTRSYILASSASTLANRYELLVSASEQESLKTVVIDVSSFVIGKRSANQAFDKKVLYFPMLSGLKNKAHSAVKYYSFWEDDYDSLYAELIFEGTKALKPVILGGYSEYSNRRGHEVHENNDQSIYGSYAEVFNESCVSVDILDENLDIITDMIELCRQKDITPIIITMPLSESYIWKNDGFDVFHDAMCKFAEKNYVLYYDFNLLKNRGMYFQDKNSYRDYEHLAETGAATMSTIMAEVVTASSENRMSSYEFYSSYEEAKKHSVYAK